VLFPVATIFGGAAVVMSRFHFTMLSLYSALLVPVVADHGGFLTGGDTGLSDVEPLELGGWRPQGVALYFVLAAVLVLAYLIFVRLVDSRWGRAWVALADDELAAQAVGIAPRPTKFGVVLVGTLFALVGGGLFVSAWPGNCLSGVPCVIGPNYFGFGLSVLLFAAVVLGGAGSRIGPLAGTALLVALSWYFDTHDHIPGNWQEVIYGALLVAVVVALPRGLASFGRLFEIPVPAAAPAVPEAPSLPPRRRPTLGLEVSGLSVRFGGVVALDGVDLDLRPGEIHALIGPNGSGKTTVVNSISGVVRPQAGTIRLGGRELPPVPLHRCYERARLGISRTFQTPRVQGSLDVRANVMQGLFRLSGGGILGTRRWLPWRRARDLERERRRRATALLKAVGLGHRLDVPAGVLSHGERRLLEVARALVSEPAVVLLDEPAAGLSPEERRTLVAVLRACRNWGCAIVLVEHDLDLVLDVADRVSVLDQGRVICSGSPDVVRADPAVAVAFMGPVG
jgi:branched-chain amino acid transport system permease protein